MSKKYRKPNRLVPDQLKSEQEKSPVSDRHEQEAQSMADHVGGSGGPVDISALTGKEPQASGEWDANSLQQQGGEGQPLPEATRSEMEQKFGTDLSNVRVHTDEKSANLNRDLDANAFTVGNNIWFGKNKFDPNSRKGKKLIAHEVTHTVQQGGQPKAVQKDGPESDAIPTESNPLPGCSQEANTCGAASLITALIMLDNESTAEGITHPKTLRVAQFLRIRLASQAQAIATKIDSHGQVAQRTGAELVAHFDRQLEITVANLSSGMTPSDGNFKTMADVLYLLVINHKRAGVSDIMWVGLDPGEIDEAMAMIGMGDPLSEVEVEPGQASTRDNVGSFDATFAHEFITRMEPGDMVQLVGQVNATIGTHAILVGRFSDGRWFWSDQGYTPPREIIGTDLEDLKFKVEMEIDVNNYWWDKPSNSTTLRVINPQ